MSDDYGQLNLGKSSHQDLLDQLRNYVEEQGRVREKQVSWILCDSSEVPWESIKDHPKISKEDIVHDFRVGYSPKYVRILLQGAREFLSEEGFLRVDEEENGGLNEIWYQYTGDAE